MARGRNQNRGRNQQIQNTQQLAKNFPLHQEQQQPQLLGKTAVQHSAAIATTITTTSNIIANAPVATINKQHSNNINTTSPSINSESYGHNNKQIKSNNKYNNYNYDANLMNTNGGEEDLKTHLETNGDPAKFSTTNTTYQMTMSNNSSENFGQVNEQDIDGDDYNYTDDDDDNCHLNEEHSNTADESTACQQSINEDDQLNNNENDECAEHDAFINHSLVIEQNVSVIADKTNNEQNNNRFKSTTTTTINGKTINGQLNDLTECDRDRLSTNNTEKHQVDPPSIAMGQKNTKGDTTKTTPSSNSSSPTPSNRAFRESSTTSTSSTTNERYTGNTKQRDQSPSINVPTITVVDCSAGAASPTAKSYDSNMTDKEEFYDFEIETLQQQQQQQQQKQSSQEFSDQLKENKENYGSDATTQKANTSYGSIQRSVSPTSMYSRYNYMKLEDVPEQEEEEDEDDDDDDDDEEEEIDTEEEKIDRENEMDEGIPKEREPNNMYASTNNLDNETQHHRHKHSNSHSPERHHHHHQHHDQQKSTNINISPSNSSINNSDYNLSSSFPDSGIGESLATSTNSRYINTNDTDCDSATSTMREIKQKYTHQRMPFVRDGNSTDCDETLMQCDDLLLDFVESPAFLDPSAERLVCIESISLPDVVVESTTSNGNSNSCLATITNNTSSSLSGTTSLGGERDFININGATGNTINSVHFIPIRVEGGGAGSATGGGSGRSSPRKQSIDDSLVGSGRASIEIIEDVTELQHQANSTRSRNTSDMMAEKLKNELLEQKSQFNAQLENAHKNVNNLQTKISEMQINIEKLEQELSAKTWNVERLQGELNAAQKDDEYVRKKLKLLEDEKTNLRHRFSENEDELKRKYDDLEIQYNELQEKYKQNQSWASELNTQLAKAQSEAEEWRGEVETIRSELEEQIRVLRNNLESSENERKICEDKWQREFEMLRTHNMDREESIMTDCEWQMRQMQRQTKDKVDKVECGRKEAVHKVELLEEELDERRKEIDDLKTYEIQVNSLRSVVSEQEYSIKSLVDQIEHLKCDLKMANDNLEEQIEAVKKIKYHCDNALYDKERQMIYRIDEVRNEAASFWEDKLYTEMTRLKNELESVYVDERREALDKLQAEHIEELKALTNRYTDNEEELRTELIETQQCLDRKTEEFVELREKSDNALLQTRMHLDRADRDYQKAMCQEEERREALKTSLREEFEIEKLEIEEKFRERLGHVKEEFSKELQINTQELMEEHKKDIAKIRGKLTADKEEALQALAEKHRKKLADVEERIKEVEVRHKRDLKDLKAAYDSEKAALDKRDISNANEIEQLHRKCRCLTNLFEEMRMRYERRDPRAEDLREISELRTRCESQERDLYLLTDRLREMQIQMNEMQVNGVQCNAMNNKNNKKSKQIKKPPPKSIPTNCDVIYEENEERESPPPTQKSPFATNQENHNDDDDDDDNDDDDDTDSTGEHDNNQDDLKSKTNHLGNVKLLIKGNQDDSHMITAV